MADAVGRLPDNIVYFGRALRRAGVPVGTAQILEALRAVQLVGFTKRQDFHTTLRAMIVTRPEHLLIFDQVFAMFWRDPDFLENMITNLLPVIMITGKRLVIIFSKKSGSRQNIAKT